MAGLLLASASATWTGWLVTSQQFDLDPAHVEVSSLIYTQPDLIRAIIDVPPDFTPNVFRISTARMERDLAALPAVAASDVYVALPDRLVVRVTERQAVFALATDTGIYLVADNGFVLYSLPSGDMAMLTVPTIEDRRDQFAPDVQVGGRLDEVSLDADLRLGAITPEMIGTGYDHLVLTANDADGYVVTAEPGGWRAIFGHYTPNLRPVDIIDRQLRCLQARVAAGEEDIAVIYLAPLDERCGTFLPRTTAAERASPT